MATRRNFLQTAILGTGILPTGLSLFAISGTPQERVRLDLDLVREMVGASHGRFDDVRRLVEQEPTLVNACHDWGEGDFETALGAASHVGAKDVARYLLDHGARIDIFCAVMLGEVGAVEALLQFDPRLIESKGPHGLSMMHHAQKGGSEAMIALLTDLGAQP